MGTFFVLSNCSGIRSEKARQLDAIVIFKFLKVHTKA